MSWDTTMTRTESPLANADPLDRPAYSLALAARYVGMPAVTLKTWVMGRRYPTREGSGWSSALIELPDARRQELSFWNLVEAWVLRAMRVEHGHTMHEIRRALDYVAGKLHVPRPLAHRSWETDGARLFVEYENLHLQAALGTGQLVQEWYVAYLERIAWNAAGMADLLFPFTRPVNGAHDPPRVVAITPKVAFGQPVIERRGVPTEAVFDRWRGGDSPGHLARDYDLTPDEVDEALRWEAYLIEAKAKAA